jgi:hypothetical protein
LVALLPQTAKWAPPPKAAAPKIASPRAVMTPNGRFAVGVVALALLIAFSLLFSTHTRLGAGPIGPPLALEQTDAAKLLPTGSDNRP